MLFCPGYGTKRAQTVSALALQAGLYITGLGAEAS